MLDQGIRETDLYSVTTEQQAKGNKIAAARDEDEMKKKEKVRRRWLLLKSWAARRPRLEHGVVRQSAVI